MAKGSSRQAIQCTLEKVMSSEQRSLICVEELTNIEIDRLVERRQPVDVPAACPPPDVSKKKPPRKVVSKPIAPDKYLT